jgi:hypothetical protein
MTPIPKPYFLASDPHIDIAWIFLVIQLAATPA